MRIVLNNNINNDLDVYFQRKLTEKCSSRYASFLNDNNIKSLLSVFSKELISLNFTIYFISRIN